MLRLDLVASSGSKQTYAIDSLDLLDLLNGNIDYVEYQTPKTSGVRFVILRYE